MRWNCMSKPLRFLQITAEHQYCPFFTVFLTIKTLSHNISITRLQISLKLHEHRGGYWRKKLPWIILEEQFSVPRNTSVSKIGNSVISLLWQLRCHGNPDHKRFSPLSNTIVGAIFPKLCLWRRSLCSNLGGIGLEKLYRATLKSSEVLSLFQCIYDLTLVGLADLPPFYRNILSVWHERHSKHPITWKKWKRKYCGTTVLLRHKLKL